MHQDVSVDPLREAGNVTSVKPTVIDDSVDHDSQDLNQSCTELFDLLPRGGLARPSVLNFSICSIVYDYFQQVCDEKMVCAEFLKKGRHRSLFVESVTRNTSSVNPVLTEAQCENNHSCCMLLVKKLFNLFSRNVLKRLNDDCLNTGCSSDRKIRKLQSRSAN